MAEQEKPGQEEEEFTLDFSNLANTIKDNKKTIVYGILIIILLFSFGLRLIPAKHYYLSAMDPYWHYRHASEILDHGYPGQELKEIDGKMIPWDYFHNAPEGSPAPIEFYEYFIAYSYKYFGRFVTPDLMTWDKYTPVIFGVLAVLMLFLLVRQLFGEKAGLAAAFMYSLSAQFLQRSVAGFADTDAPVAFFTLLTLFLFIRAWDRESYIYAILGGISLGFFAFTWPGGYAFAPMLILVSAVIFLPIKILRDLFSKEGMLETEKWNYLIPILGVLSILILMFLFKPIAMVLYGLLLILLILVAYPILLTFQKDKKHLFTLIKKDWKKYAVVAIFLVIGILLVTLLVGFQNAQFWKLTVSFTGIKAIQTATEAGCPNVLRTVAEMNPASLRSIVYRVHIISIIFAIVFFALLPLGLWKKMMGKIYHLLFFVLWLVATLYASTVATRFIQMFAVPLAIFVGIAIAELISKMDAKKPMLSILVVAFIGMMIFAVPNITPSGTGTQPSYYTTANLIAKQSGPGIDGNWVDFYAWMRTETPEDAIMASWWDPGHGVTAVGERAVVADGSQHHCHVYDLAQILTGTDETEVVEYLKKYQISYFFVSSDLINKYGAISYLGSGGVGGENYLIVGLSEQPQQTEEGILYMYGTGNTVILVSLEGNVATASIRQGYQSQKIDRVFYFTEEGGMIKNEPGNDTLDAMLYVSPDYSLVVFLPPHLENNMLTRLFYFNGEGLEHFEFVQNFGGQIKVYKVKY